MLSGHRMSLRLFVFSLVFTSPESISNHKHSLCKYESLNFIVPAQSEGEVACFFSPSCSPWFNIQHIRKHRWLSIINIPSCITSGIWLIWPGVPRNAFCLKRTRDWAFVYIFLYTNRNYSIKMINWDTCILHPVLFCSYLKWTLFHRPLLTTKGEMFLSFCC